MMILESIDAYYGDDEEGKRRDVAKSRKEEQKKTNVWRNENVKIQNADDMIVFMSLVSRF